MAKVEINPEVAHLITAPVKDLTYSFKPDGSMFVGDREHLYFSQSKPRSSREIGFVEYVPLEVRAAISKKATKAAVDEIFEALLSPAA
jgi:hypothetical protein